MNDSLVGVLEVTDPDLGQRHRCKLLNNSIPFYIDNSVNPPLLKTVRSLDFESARVQYVDVQCEDISPGQAPHFIYKRFAIHVIGRF